MRRNLRKDGQTLAIALILRGTFSRREHSNMGARSGRLRVFALAGMIALLATGCETPTGKPAGAPSADREMDRAERLAHSGQHANAAQAYQDVAALTTATEFRNRAHLRSADEWALAGEWDKAGQQFSQITGELPANEVPLRARVAATLALHAQRPDRALTELDRVQAPLPADMAPDLLALRARAQFALNQPAQGIATAFNREHYLNGSAEQRANSKLIWEGVQRSAANGADFTVKPGTPPVIAGWMDLNRAALAVARNPFTAARAVADWQKQYPTHPANALLNEEILPQLTAGVEYPAHIALILPLTGKQLAAGVAVRDGFLAALLQQDSTHRPTLNIYDSASLGAAVAYKRAISDGAQFVIGPLTKDEVTAVAASGETSVPTLALNYLADSVTAPAFLFQYALDPEEEARQLAQRAVNERHMRALVLLPRNDWGQRMFHAFDTELRLLGGSIAAVQYYDAAARDYSTPVRDALLIDESVNRSKALSALVGTALEFEPRHRGDFDFVFIGAQPTQGRSLRPALRFFLPNDLAVYATSDIFEPSTQANDDLNGVVFPDMPWVISPDEVSTQLRESLTKYWPTRARARGRLYAFGFDAYRLVPLLRAGGRKDGLFVPGLTGRLTVDDHGRVHRELDWAQIQNGQPVPKPYIAESTSAQNR
jgi:uncharacterized protein